MPAGILAAIVIMEGFLKHVSDMGGLLMALSGGVLGASAFVVLIPFGIMIFGGPKKIKAAAEKPAKAKADDDAPVSASVAELSEGDVDVLETSGEAQIVDSDADSVALDDDEIDATTAFTTPASGTDLGDEDVVEMEDLDDFATMDEISDEVILEDDEDDMPKKKRR